MVPKVKFSAKMNVVVFDKDESPSKLVSEHLVSLPSTNDGSKKPTTRKSPAVR